MPKTATGREVGLLFDEEGGGDSESDAATFDDEEEATDGEDAGAAKPSVENRRIDKGLAAKRQHDGGAAKRRNMEPPPLPSIARTEAAPATPEHEALEKESMPRKGNKTVKLLAPK